jgi:predicted ThiF/HesA family dinucleotide-utilizing enzyme
MSHPLVDRNEDLRQLQDEGYCVGIVGGGNLVVRDVPYLAAGRVVKTDGVLICKLNLNGDIVNRPDAHWLKFAGEMPHGVDGQPIHGLGAAVSPERFSDDLMATYQFSCMPKTGMYESYAKKIRTYIAYLWGPARQIDPSVTPHTKRILEPEDDTSPFMYLDTASARAEIEAISAKLAVERVAIVGLGGTGAYVLDLLGKTAVNEIHLYDGDILSSHNAFRSPGAASKDELHAFPFKVDYFKAKYSVLHKRIFAHPEYIASENIEQLRNMQCVFLCIDANPGKRPIVERLESFGVTFIDTGMGLTATNGMISGILRATTSQPDNRDKARAQMPFATTDGADVYDKNIQVADLNALNAILAVMKWKKLRGFYYDSAKEWQVLFATRSNLITFAGAYEPD